MDESLKSRESVEKAMSGKLKKKFLNLKEKIEVIEKSKNLSARKIANIYGCGRTQINEILKRKSDIEEQWLKFQYEGSKLKRRKTDGENIEQALLEWFSNCRAKNMPISAIQIAKKLGISDFKASNGWLEKFRKRNNICFKKICGELSDVSTETVGAWKERLPSIIEGYSEDDIFNGDETGLFFRATPDKTL